MNRAPGPNDNWWSDHSRTCGGKFTKVKEPENYRHKNSSSSTTKDSSSLTSSSSSSSFPKTNNKLKNDSGVSKGKGKGKGASARNSNQNGNNNNNNNVDIRTLFSQQQQQRDQSNSGDALNGTNNGWKANEEDARPSFTSLVDKENFKNAAFSGFGRMIFQNNDIQVRFFVSRAYVSTFSLSRRPLSSIFSLFLLDLMAIKRKSVLIPNSIYG